MDDADEFTTVVKFKTSQLVDGAPTTAALNECINKYISAVRGIAVAPQNAKARVQMLASADDVFLKELQELADTEHDDQVQPGDDQHEQPGDDQAATEQPAAKPAAVVEKHTKKKRGS